MARLLVITSLLGLGLAAGAQAATGPAIALSSVGAIPEGADFRFASEGVGEQPGDFLVRPQVENRLRAKGFRLAAQAPRYVVEVAVTARPLDVGALEGPADAGPAWLDAPIARTPGRGGERVCAVAVRFIDASTGAEVYRVKALQHAAVADCNTENPRLVDAALADAPVKRPAR